MAFPQAHSNGTNSPKPVAATLFAMETKKSSRKELFIEEEKEPLEIFHETAINIPSLSSTPSRLVEFAFGVSAFKSNFINEQPETVPVPKTSASSKAASTEILPSTQPMSFSSKPMTEAAKFLMASIQMDEETVEAEASKAKTTPHVAPITLEVPEKQLAFVDQVPKLPTFHFDLSSYEIPSGPHQILDEKLPKFNFSI